MTILSATSDRTMLFSIILNDVRILHLQFQEGRIDRLNSVITLVYHVAISLSSELQLDFVDSALQYIFPCCMSHKSNLRIHAQVRVFQNIIYPASKRS